ncbi:MAG: uncharacterized protein H6Q89_5081 [Myxococcaceae bacterium]|nr:uncharacterized protein [Myxococcaceae bacterium]
MTHSGVLAACVAGVLGGCLPVSPASDAGPNLLDPTFGDGGTTLKSFGCTDYASANALVVVDGGFVAGGGACQGWALVGYSHNGAIDPSFGDAGTALLFSGTSDFAQIDQLLVRPDGRLLVRGTRRSGTTLRQLSASGAEDTAFTATVDQALSDRNITLVNGMWLQADGKVLLAFGTTLYRMLPDGSLDASFGVGGAVVVQVFNSSPTLSCLLVQPDGKIVLCGADSGDSVDPTFVARLSADGALDPTFGSSGVMKVKAPAGSRLMLRSAALQGDGKLVLAGMIRGLSSAPWRAAVWRITPGGAFDETFGARGKAEPYPGVGASIFSAVAVLGEGKVLAAGSYQGADLQDAWQLARFTAFGELDPTFGHAGATVFAVRIPWSPGGAKALAVTPEGYVIAGMAYPVTPGPSVFGLARIVP